jgi:tRNA threonylcarbamoyl adenosine modification protein (Sua5/YciO/YrdC/YwlC family)
MASIVSLGSPAALDRAEGALDRGEVVVIPTDTVYGLAACAGSPGASATVFALKQRPTDVPLAVLVADEAQAVALLDDLPDWAAALMDDFWPGPLTIVGRRRPGVTLDLGASAGTVGVRCPDHEFVRALSDRVGPLATTSANLHGQPTPRTAAAVIAQLAPTLGPESLVVDGGPCTGSASTVVDVTGAEPVVLRQGPVDLATDSGRGAP